MPAVYQGNATRNSTATPWGAGQVRALGSLCTPSTPTGQVFICTVGGTTTTEPSWNTPPFPTLGTVFAEAGGPSWTCYGTQPGQFATIAQLPVDGDPPLAFPFVLSQETILDALAYLEANVGFLAGYDNIWTGENTFSAPSSFGGTVTFTDYTATYEAEFFTLDPSVTSYLLITKWRIGNVSGTPIYARLYAANNGLTTAFLGISINAGWNGTGWQYDSTIRPATLFEFQSYGLTVLNYPASNSSPWLYTDWVPGLQLLSPLSVGSGLTITTAGVVSQIAEQATAGQVGVPGVLASSGLVGAIVSTGATSLLSYSLPVTGLYRLSVYTKQTSGGAYSGGAPSGVLSYPGGNTGFADSGVSGSPWASPAVDGSSFITWDASVVFKSAAGAMTFTLQAPATGNWEGWAVLELVA